jgi:hypothetical protein
VQLADAVPLRGVGAEIVLARPRPGRGAPRTVARGQRINRIARIERAPSARGKLGAAAALGERKNAQEPFAEALDQARLRPGA